MEDVHRLRIFMAVAQHLSFTRAAQDLFLTQSAVSHQIAALEAELNTPLLSRENRSVRLTPAGRTLQEHARRIFATMDEAKIAVRSAGRSDYGSIRIGASPAACQYLVPESLREFRECYPDYTIAITVADSPQIIPQISDGSIDLGIVIRSERDKHLAFHDLFQDELGILLSPLHSWAIAGKVDRSQIADQHFVMYSRNSATFRIVERHLLKLRAPLRSTTELGSMEAIKELVKLGLGISITAPWIAAAEIRSRSLVWLKIPGPPLRRVWSIAVRAGRRMTIGEQTFLGLVRTAALNLRNASDLPADVAG